MNILHIISNLGVGGAEKVLIGIINGLKEFDHHLVILRGPETLKTELPANCKVVNLHMSRWRYFFLKVIPLRRYIRKHKIDIVHSHLYQPNILARIVTPLSVPLFNNLHSISSMGAYRVNRNTLYLEKWTYRKHHYIIAVSNTVMNDFDKWVGIKGPHKVLYNFIDDRFLVHQPKTAYSKDRLRLVAVGNLRYEKNYPYLLEVFKNLPRTVSLDIYGDGVLRPQIEEQITKYNLNIRLCGVRNDLHKILPDYDAFIMSSHFEGQPVALLEAMACGLPAILPDIPVLREVCGNDVLYINTMDTGSLANTIKNIQNGDVDLKRLSQQGVMKAKNFSRSRYIDQLRDIYIKAGKTATA